MRKLIGLTAFLFLCLVNLADAGCGAGRGGIRGRLADRREVRHERRDARRGSAGSCANGSCAVEAVPAPQQPATPKKK